jgi:hypothetical protein
MTSDAALQAGLSFAGHMYFLPHALQKRGLSADTIVRNRFVVLQAGCCLLFTKKPPKYLLRK